MVSTYSLVPVGCAVSLLVLYRRAGACTTVPCSVMPRYRRGPDDELRRIAKGPQAAKLPGQTCGVDVLFRTNKAAYLLLQDIWGASFIQAGSAASGRAETRPRTPGALTAACHTFHRNRWSTAALTAPGHPAPNLASVESQDISLATNTNSAVADLCKIQMDEIEKTTATVTRRPTPPPRPESSTGNNLLLCAACRDKT